MAGPSLDYTYRYAAPSFFESRNAGDWMHLGTSAVPHGVSHFFQGTLIEPRRTADLLLALVRVVQSRFHLPAQMLQRIIALSDPVVTCSEDRLRFEGFSACCSTYARVDLLPSAVDGVFLGHGTTNVDFNPPMRAALARVREREPVRLSVGSQSVEVTTSAAQVVERKVPLPLRWLKGFVESQSYLAGMELRLEVPGSEARRFLRSLPRGAGSGRPTWIARSGPGLRLTQVASRDTVRVAGIERLRLLEDLSRHVQRLRVYATADGQATAWELDCGDARFQLALSPEVWRGFSGEGQLLSSLAREVDTDAVDTVRAALRWQTALVPERLASECRLPLPAVRTALARLAAGGLVGYDLNQSAYYHRELPFELSRVEELQPRLKDARKLVAEEGVRLETRSEELLEAWVRGSDVEHRVRITPEGARCTCPWFSKHQGERGPCKHVLALQLTLEDEIDARGA